MSATTSAPKINPVAANLAARAAFIAGSVKIRRTLPNVPIIAGQANYAIPLNNQGALIGVDLEVVLNVTNGTAAANAPNVGSPYSFFSNINFVDQGNTTRHSLSGRYLWDYLAMRGVGVAAPYGALNALAEGGATVSPISYPGVPTLAASAAGVVKFLLHVPIARSWKNTMGMVMLQTGNQNQPALLNLQLTSLITGQPNSPYAGAITITGGTITPHQCYYQPYSGTPIPQLDTSLQWVLSESQPDSTNVVTGVTKEVGFQNQFSTSLVGIRYFNGNGYAAGTDIASIILKKDGGTTQLDDDGPALRFQRYRINHGWECAPGLYWFDFQDAPLLQSATGVYQADFTLNNVNAGAYMTYLYDWTKVPASLGVLPGLSQLG